MLQYVWFGVVTGAFLLIATIGFALVGRVNKFLNIAHAEYMSIGALLTYGLSTAGIPFLVAAVISVVAVAGLGLLVGRLVYEPMLSRGPEILLIVSVGVVYLVHGTTEVFVAPGTKTYDLPRPTDWHIGSLAIGPYEVLVVVVAAACFAGLYVFLTKTSAGMSIRAISDNRQLAEIRGINLPLATRYVWLLSSGLAAIAGILLGVIGTLTTDLAFEQILLILAVSILAGLGSVYGVAIAAIVIGVTMDVSTMAIPSGYRTAVAFLVIIIVLMFRPQGLFGKTSRVA